MRPILIAAALIGIASAALAGDGTTTVYKIDLNPSVQLLLDYAVAGFTGLVAWVIGRQAVPAWVAHLTERTDQMARDGLHQIVRRGIRWAAEKIELDEIVGDAELYEQVIATAAQYVSDSAPGWVAKFGLTPTRIAQMVRARMDEELAAIRFERESVPTVVSEPLP